MNELPISFCTSCKGREHHLFETLPKNLADNADYRNLQITILNYNSPGNIKERLQSEYKAELDSGRILYVEFPEAVGFNMTHSKNMSHRAAVEYGNFQKDNDHILCNVDADNFTGEGFAQYLNNYFQENDKGFLCYHGVISNVRKILNRDKGSIGVGGGGGRLALRKNDFYSVRGYDEEFVQSWGPDDSQLINRLSRHLSKIPGSVEAKYLKSIDHSDEERLEFTPSPEAHEQSLKALKEVNEIRSKSNVSKLLARLAKEAKLAKFDIVRQSNKFGNGKVIVGIGENSYEAIIGEAPVYEMNRSPLINYGLEGSIVR